LERHFVKQALNSSFAVNTYSYTLKGPVQTCLKKLASRGFQQFELMMYPGHLWPDELDGAKRKALRDYLRGEDLSVRTINMPNVDLNIAAATRDMRQMTLGLLRKFIVLAGDLGAGGLVLGPGKPNPLFPMDRRLLVDHFFAALNELLPVAKDCQVPIYIENMPFSFLPKIDDMLAVLDTYGDPDLGVVYDVANGHFMGEDLPQAIALCSRRLRVLHVSDTGQSVYRHDAVGLGTVDFSAIPSALKAIGFRDKPVLEIIDPHPDTSIDLSVERLAAWGWAQN
jgi:L-ribulose-5-phosphate 3-epimerase